MLTTLEAVIEEDGRIRLLENVKLRGGKRALVTILEEDYESAAGEAALLSEASLAQDWNREEEDRAWQHPAAGAVVLVRFPFSDLTSSKLRPAVVLADAGREDVVLCQVTSNPYSDSRAIPLTDASFASGGLQRISYARPAKLFTASGTIILREVERLVPEVHSSIIKAIVDLLQGG